MSCEIIVVRGVQIRYPFKKRKFSAIIYEELMNFTAIFGSDNSIDIHC